jgi:hypothetical protein
LEVKVNLVNRTNETKNPINPLGGNAMKRYILAGLSVLALSAYATPGFALSDRFEQARLANLDKGISAEVNLNDRFERARLANLDKGISAEVNLNDRFERARLANLDK